MLLLVTGCAEVTPWPEDSAIKPTVEMIELEQYGTAQAHESAAEQAELELKRQREAAQHQYAMLTAEAQRTSQAHQRSIEQQRQHATQQAANATQAAQSTVQSVSVETTREAMHAQATATQRSYSATATRQVLVESQQATVTRRASDATVTAAVVNTRATATAGTRQERATATAQAVLAERERLELQRERWLQPVRTVGPVLLILAAVVSVGWIGWRATTVIEDRARVIRRRGDEGEPVVLVTRERLAMPMRQFNPLLIAEPGNEHAPELASPAFQEGTTARQQAANLETARHAHQHRDGQRLIVLPAGEPHHSKLRDPQRGEPGLLGVTEAARLEQATEAGLLPKQLADAIEGRWEELDDA
jgi:hypothetical protein